jgi:hypothetical protein
MLKDLPANIRTTAAGLINRAASDLGIPQDQARRILYWHCRRTKATLRSLGQLQSMLEDMSNIVRAYNQGVAFQQLRRQGPSTLHAEEEASER